MTKKFSVTHTHASAAAATQAAPGAGKRILITDIIGSSDKPDAQIKIIEDTAGTPVTKFQAQFRVDATNNGIFHHTFKTPFFIIHSKHRFR